MSSAIRTMMRLTAILNPLEPPLEDQSQILSQAVILAEEKLHSKTRYPSCMVPDNILAALIEKHKLAPPNLREITENRKHIPYSDRETKFFRETGRDSLEGNNLLAECGRAEMNDRANILFSPSILFQVQIPHLQCDVGLQSGPG